MTDISSKQKLFEAIRGSNGKYSMLALDQRESLRAMFPRDENGAPAADRQLVDFKVAGVNVLSEYASAVLLDREFGLAAPEQLRKADNAGLIVAGDFVYQDEHGGLLGSDVDPSIGAEYLQSVGAAALKYLVIWRPGVEKAERARQLEQTIAVAQEAGVLSLIEPIVRPDDNSNWTSVSEKHDAILRAAEEIAPYRPDIYKAEVPGYSPGDVSRVAEHSAELSKIVDGDWVILSNGVADSEFPTALFEAMKGGARGFLAGRAIWKDVVAEKNHAEVMAERSIGRLKELVAITDKF